MKILSKYIIAMFVSFFGGIFKGSLIVAIWGKRFEHGYIKTYAMIVDVVLLSFLIFALFDSIRKKDHEGRSMAIFLLVIWSAMLIGEIDALQELNTYG